LCDRIRREWHPGAPICKTVSELEVLRGAALIAAAITMGLMAGVFFISSDTIIPACAKPMTGPSLARSRRSTGRSSTRCS